MGQVGLKLCILISRSILADELKGLFNPEAHFSSLALMSVVALMILALAIKHYESLF
jgi:hypothetical protein